MRAVRTLNFFFSVQLKRGLCNGADRVGFQEIGGAAVRVTAYGKEMRVDEGLVDGRGFRAWLGAVMGLRHGGDEI